MTERYKNRIGDHSIVLYIPLILPIVSLTSLRRDEYFSTEVLEGTATMIEADSVARAGALEPAATDGDGELAIGDVQIERQDIVR